MVIAQVGLRQNCRKRLSTVLPGLAAFAFQASARGEFAFGQFVFEELETQFVLMVVIGNGGIHIGAGEMIVIGEGIEGVIPKFDPKALIE